MKRKLLIALLAGLITGGVIQEVKIIRKLIEERKNIKEIEKQLKDLKELKDKIELERLKKQIEEAKKNDPLKAEMEKYKNLSEQISETKDPEELDKVLIKAVEDGVIKDPWDGDFDEFMSNPNNSLHF